MMSADLSPQRVIVEWREEYNTGIDEIDRQHQHLFSLVKYLGIETIDETLDELTDFVFTHIATEQKLMVESNYPELDHHRQVHDRFVLTVAEGLSSDQAWDDDRINKLRKFLNVWLSEHILVDDQTFACWYENYKKSLKGQKNTAQSVRRQGWVSRIVKNCWFVRYFGND